MNVSKYLSVALLLMVSVMAQSSAYAYSYAAAGKEPLIEGREVILSGLAEKNYAAVAVAVKELKEEFDYLLNDHNVDLHTPMKAAIDNKNSQQIEAVIDHAMVEEIIRRLDGAEQNLADYQVAKVLVVKSKLFLDLLLPKLNEQQRVTASDAIQQVLASIGNPGVFGVGQAPADPERFKQQRTVLLTSLEGLKKH